MQITIQHKKDNVLLHRLEVQGTLQFTGATPSNVQLAEAVAKQLKSEIPLVVMKHIYTAFGKQQGTFSAVVYADLASRQRIEMQTKHLKKKAEEETKKKAEEAAQPAAAGA